MAVFSLIGLCVVHCIKVVLDCLLVSTKLSTDRPLCYILNIDDLNDLNRVPLLCTMKIVAYIRLLRLLQSD